MTDVYQAMAHPARRQILALLRERAMSAGELAEHFDFSKPTLSGHFQVLRDVGLVSTERNGTSMIYRINLSVAEDALSGLMGLLKIGDESALADLPESGAKKKGTAT